MSEAVTFTRAGFARGFRRGNAFALGVLAYGVGFGLAADQAGLSAVQAFLVSLFVYSGSAQMAALSILTTGTSLTASVLWSIVALILVINARYVLFGATLRPWLGQVSPFKAYSTLYILGDGNWLLSLNAYENGERDAGFVLGSALGPCLAWLAGTVIGSVIGGNAPNPRVLGLDFMLIAFSAAMMVGMFRQRSDALVVTVAAVAALFVAWGGAPAWAPVIAGIAGGVFAWLRFTESDAV